MTDPASPAVSSVRELRELTTLRVGGPADRVHEPATRDELIATALDMWSSVDDWLILGGGSNVVVSDDGVSGDVLHVVTRGISARPHDDRTVHLLVEAGEPWDAVVADAVESGLAGIEALPDGRDGARIDLTVTFHDETVLGKAQVRVALA